jgi:CheY-like chemotaxis protein
MNDKAPRVLVIDDQESATHILESLLRRRGYAVRTVNDSRKALKAAREFVPQVVLLDIAMPHMNGYEVARRIRAEPTLKEVPIIAVTAFGHEEHRKRAEAAGIDHQVLKPTDIDALEGVVQELLQQSRRTS